MAVLLNVSVYDYKFMGRLQLLWCVQHQEDTLFRRSVRLTVPAILSPVREDSRKRKEAPL